MTANETSYDTGLKPFNHDKNRGKWSSPKDFFFACIGHAFKADSIIIMPTVVLQKLGVYALIPYFLVSALCVVPILLMQSFIGQFSSTGFISAFRIAPLFKGIGYVSLAINLLTLTYYSMFSAIPLFYFFNSLRPTIPWSCEGAVEWMKLVSENFTTPCVRNVTFPYHTMIKVPSVEYFRLHTNSLDRYTTDEDVNHTFSFQLLACSLIVWIMVLAIITKPVQTIGKFMRYSFLTVIGILGFCLARFIFLPGAWDGLVKVFHAHRTFYFESFLLVPGVALSALGPGWGSVLTMASYNDFKTNIYKSSWFLCLGEIGVMIGLALLTIFIKFPMETTKTSVEFLEAQWMEFLVLPTGITFLEFPNFWSLLVFGLLVLGSFNLIVIQLFSVLTSLFDEFENLRTMKKQVAVASVAILAVVSIYFCSNHGVAFFGLLTKLSILTQVFLNLMLLLVVLWVYGRERFQSDLKFMTRRVYSTFMVNIARFITPLFLLFILLVGTAYRFRDENTHIALHIFGILIISLPWLLVPTYCIFKIMQTSGTLGMRFKRSTRPTDWYPADPHHKQRYEETFLNTEVSHHLTQED